MASAAGFVFPAAGEIVSDFGYRRHPILGTLRLHAGIDIGAPDGSDVWAAKAGEVILAGWNGGYGNCVMVAHDGGVVTLYGHMSALYVSEGQSVGQGASLHSTAVYTAWAFSLSFAATARGDACATSGSGLPRTYSESAVARIAQ